ATRSWVGRIRAVVMTGSRKTVMAGLAPAIHGSTEPIVRVCPIRIHREYDSHSPRSRPMLHIALTQDCRSNICVSFCDAQPLEPTSLLEATAPARPMLPHAACQVTRHARIERPVGRIGNG